MAPASYTLPLESFNTAWTNLPAGDTYTWRIRACADAACLSPGPWSATWTFTYAPSNTITRRSTYYLAGQAVAVRQVIPGETNNLLHLHSDHLGSNSVMSYSSSGGMVAGSRTRYLPFGGYRTTPSQTFTDHGYTSQRHNDDLGLIYYNARYYLPGVGRFVSADSIVPDATNPQSFNRYTYVLNNPIALIDPSGHRTCSVDEGGQDFETCDQNLGTGLDYGNDLIANTFPYIFSGLLADYVALGLIDFDTAVTLALDDAAVYVQNVMGDDAFAEGSRILAQNITEGHRFLPSDFLSNEVNTAIAMSYLASAQAQMQLGQQFGGDLNRQIQTQRPTGDCSFSADTLVLTEAGLIPIAEVSQHNYAWAYNEGTEEFGFYPIVAVWSHEDPVILYLTIGDDTIATTPNHPFFTVAGEWTYAGELRPGDQIRMADWHTGTVESLIFTPGPQTMYNFTVAIAHTYFVGNGQWLVHNECYGDYSGSLQNLRRLTNKEVRDYGLHQYKQQLQGVRGNYDFHVDISTGDIYVVAPKANFYNWVDTIPSLVRR